MPKQTLEQMLHTAAWTGQPPGLERISALLDRLGNPQNQLKFIHIAGTNGKGSTAAMTASVLTAAGFKTALFTSPHLTHLGERFKIDGAEMTPRQQSEILAQVLAVAEGIEPTEFDLMTAMAFLHFARTGCQMVVLEVGLGGRLDATNVIQPPLVAAITNIGLDHTAILGDTLPAIAAEKAGILKGGSPCVLYHQRNEVMEVVQSICQEKSIPLTTTNPHLLTPLEQKVEGQRFHYGDKTYESPLLGGHQLNNAMVALEIIHQLRDQGWDIPEDAVVRGLRETSWAGRMELLSRSPDFLVDGGHNPQCLGALMDGLRQIYARRKMIFLMGILGDKNVEEMVNLTAPLAKCVVTITPDSPRALPAHALAEEFIGRGISAMAAGSVAEGVALARQLAGEEDVICAFGSLYIVGEIRALMAAE